jgi:hypothetical protein
MVSSSFWSKSGDSKKKDHFKKVVIDARMLGYSEHETLSETVKNIGKSLASLPKLDIEPLFLVPVGYGNTFYGFEALEVNTHYLDIKESVVIPLICRRVKAKLFHTQGLSVFYFLPCPYLITLDSVKTFQVSNPTAVPDQTMIQFAYTQTLFKKYMNGASQMITPYSQVRDYLMTTGLFSKKVNVYLNLVETTLTDHDFKDLGKSIHELYQA